MLRSIYRWLPPRARARLKSVVSAVGHQTSFLDPLRARHQATTKKKFDSVASYLSEHLKLAGIRDLENKRCLEFGCGHVPTELAFYHLLGASHLTAIDYHRIAQFQYMPLALRGSPVKNFDARRIEYIAPLNAVHDRIPSADFIHSEAVLEHVHPNDIRAILRNLADALSSGGVMIHNIDLRDHMYWHEDPNAFLLSSSDYRSCDHDARGNRLRKSDWVRLFNELDGVETTCHAEVIEPRYLVSGYTRDDLSTLRVVMVSHKRKTG